MKNLQSLTPGYWIPWQKFKRSKSHSEINWPLNESPILGEVKGKSSLVPFHRINSPYSYYFEEIWIIVPIQQEAKHDQEKLSAELNWKFCWQSPAMYCFFTHQAKIQICCRVKLILCHIYCSYDSTNAKIPHLCVHT